MAVKNSVKKVSVKEVASKPSVTVETKKISNSDSGCSTGNYCKMGKHCFMILLLLANTVLLALVLMNQSKMEELRAGGKENYGLLKQVFETEGYKTQQRQQLEQALQVLANPQQAAQQPTAEAVQANPEVEQGQPQEQLQ